MEIRNGIDSLPLDDGASVVTIGFFDGVHLGHRAVFERTVDAARARGARAVAVTFDRHPRETLTPDNVPRLLTTTERKAALIAETGLDVLVVLGFTKEFSLVPAEDFVRDVLAAGLHTLHVVVGANFTFGHRALGTIDTLRETGPAFGFTAEPVELLEVEGKPVSSSSIRTALADGDLTWPARALGRRYTVDGNVVGGAGRGRGLGYPTANLETEPRLLLPSTGIYAGRASGAHGVNAAAISVGTNPTFGVEPLHVEAHLLDFEGDLHGRPLSVEFWGRLRDEERFDDVLELVKAMDEDVRRTREIVLGGDDD